MKKVNRIVKRVQAVIIAIAIVVFNVFTPVSAAMVIPAAEGTLEILAFLLVSAGVITLEESTEMSIPELEAELTVAMADEAKKQSLVNAMKIAASSSDFIAMMSELGLDFAAWVQSHVDDVNQVTVTDGFDLSGYGCSIQYYVHAGAWLNVYYGSYGIATLISSDTYGLNVYGDDVSYMQYYTSSGDIRTDLTSVSDGVYVGIYSPEISSNGDNGYKLYGSWYYEDGTLATDILSAANGEVTADDIGTVTIDGVDYPISDDGTVTIDGVTYVINDDGSITIDGDVYYPTYDLPYDDTAVEDLINQIIINLGDIVIIDNTTDTAIEDIIDSVDDVTFNIAELDTLKVPASISTVFPFCLPFDFVRGIKLLSSAPVAPKFEIPFTIPSFGQFEGVEHVVSLDFADYSKYFEVGRWVQVILFSLCLCFITTKLVKGAK